jgi:hypothetical protein
MSTFTKVILSGSTNGRAIKVVAVATAGTTIHTTPAGTSSIDEVWLYAQNNHTSAVDLTIEFGGVSAPDDLIQMQIPSKSGLYLICPGLNLQNSLLVRAFASVANVISIQGFVNRIS